jgi:GTP-binding protein Era
LKGSGRAGAPAHDRPVFRSGLVTIVGRTNVGKSTLLNRLVGRKVAIMSEKPQTTRNRIVGVVNREAAQIVFIDTPGIHRPRHRLGEYMVGAALGALEEVEAVLFVVEAPEAPGPGDRFVAERLEKLKTPIILVVNKADLCPGSTTRTNLEAYRALGEFAAGLVISAVKDETFELLLRTIESILPEGPRYYPEGMDTDQPEAFVIAELVREKVLALTREEVPHSVAVAVEEMRAGGARVETLADAERRRPPDEAGTPGGGLGTGGVGSLGGSLGSGGVDVFGGADSGFEDAPARPDLLYTRAVVYVERESQKGILIGAKGSMLKEIGRLAREEMEALFGNKVYLELRVKVERDWRDRAPILRALGYTLPRD